MLPEIIKNLFRKKATRNYPAVKRVPFPNVRGELVNDISQCIFCKICETKCPANCIEIDKDKRTWTYDPMECVYCGICSESCPKKCLSHKPEYRPPMTKRQVITLRGKPLPPKPAPEEKKSDTDTSS